MRVPRSIIKIMSLALILLCLNFAYGATATQDVTVTVSESVQIIVIWNGTENNPFTLNVYALPGREYYWPGGVEGLQIKSLSNVPIDLYVKAEGDLKGPGIIPIENLKYADYGSGVPKTPFKKDYALVKKDWKVRNLEESIIPVDLYLDVPIGTPPGAYSVKIYHVAVKSY